MTVHGNELKTLHNYMSIKKGHCSVHRHWHAQENEKENVKGREDHIASEYVMSFPLPMHIKDAGVRMCTTTKARLGKKGELNFMVIALPWNEQVLKKMYANFWNYKKMIREEEIRLQVSRCCFPTHNTNQRCRHKNVYNDQRMLRQELRFMVISFTMNWTDVEENVCELEENKEENLRDEKIGLQVSRWCFSHSQYKTKMQTWEWVQPN